VGSPASPGGVTAGKALHRTIALGCSTILEDADDTDSSATDFSEQTPNPRNNASPITETDCETPEARIDSRPTNPTQETSAAFLFRSIPTGAVMECKLDTGPFQECQNLDDEPFEYPGPLADGSHTFQVRGVNSQGTGAATGYTWIVDTQPPTATINTAPANPSSGASAAFTYGSSQLGSTFACSLASQGQADSFASCPSSGMTYAGLGDGSYTFKVRATDKAGNEGTPVTYTWQVNNSLVLVPPAVVASPLLTIPGPAVKPQPAPVLRCKKGFVKKKGKCVKKRAKKRKKHKRGRKHG
jgi:hypothetical protein